MILHLLKGKIQKVLRIFRLVKTTFLKVKKISCSPAAPFPQIQVCQMIMTVMMKKTDILPETFFYCNPFRYNGNNVQTSRSGTTATTYEQVDDLYLYTVWHVSFVYYIYAYFSMTWYLICTKLQHNTSLICNYIFFFISLIKFI